MISNEMKHNWFAKSFRFQTELKTFFCSSFRVCQINPESPGHVEGRREGEGGREGGREWEVCEGRGGGAGGGVWVGEVNGVSGWVCVWVGGVCEWSGWGVCRCVGGGWAGVMVCGGGREERAKSRKQGSFDFELSGWNWILWEIQKFPNQTNIETIEKLLPFETRYNLWFVLHNVSESNTM